MSVARGSLIKVDLDPTQGHEQGAQRPCIVLSATDIVALQRYAVLVVVPLTGTTGLGNLYPVVQPYPRGLTKPSTVLVDQIRAIDKVRVRGSLAPIPRDHMARIDAAVRRVLGL